MASVPGTAGNDTLTGTNGDDVINGFDGADVINTGLGSDTVDGGAGDDVINVGQMFANIGRTVIDGGAGYDTVKLISGYQIFLNQAIPVGALNAVSLTNVEKIVIGVSQAVVTGSSGADVIVIEGPLGQFNGMGGDDVVTYDGYGLIDGGLGNDTFTLGETTTLTYASALAGITLDLRVKTAQNTGGSGFDTVISVGYLRGSAFADVLTAADSGTAEVHGLAGADTLNGGAAQDQLFGGDDADVLKGGGGDDVLNGGAGDDTLDGGAGRDWVSFSDLSGVVVDLALTTRQTTGHGADIYLAIENVIGSGGADTLSGGAEANDLNGGSGNDVLYGRGGDDVLRGGAGYAGESDSLYGGDGDDLLSGSGGGELFDGGAGTDTVDLQESAGRGRVVDLSLTSAQDAADGKAGDRYVGIENLLGGYYADRFTGGAEANRFEGGEGDDILRGGGGADVLLGGAGRDRFIFQVGGGADIVEDYDRTQDFITIEGLTGAVRLLQQGADTRVVINASDSFLLKNVQASSLSSADLGGAAIARSAIVGTAAGETLTGDDDVNFILALAGNDTVAAGGQRDVVAGGHGDDILRGGLGNDLLSGDAGFDRLEGEDGNDRLVDAGGGNDTLVGGLGDDVAVVARSYSGARVASTLSLDGGDGADRLVVDDRHATATLLGGAQDDQLTVLGAYSATIDAGAGADIVRIGEVPGATVTLGTGQDVLALMAGAGRRGAVVVNDFAAGDGGDVLDLWAWLDGGLALWNGVNPLASGRVRLTQSGADTLVQYDYAGNGAVWTDLARLKNVTATALTAYNLAMLKAPTLPSRPTTINGTGAGETLTGTAAGETIRGEGGDDRLNGEDGVDVLYGGDGNDVIDTGIGGDFVDGGAGADRIDARAGADVIFGGDGADTITGNYGPDFIDGGAGNDGISARGAATVFGGAGDDGISGVGVGGILDGGAGDDILTSEGGRAYGGAGTDRINGYDLTDDFLDGGTGDDTIAGFDGRDTLLGQDGDDKLYGDAGDDVLLGGQGADRLEGGAGDDLLFGGDGSDVLVAGAGLNQLEGGAGDDLLISDVDPNGLNLLRGGDGDDRFMVQRLEGAIVEGGAGRDFIYFGQSANPAVAGAIVANLAAGTVTQGDTTLLIADIEGVEGGAGDDILVGGPGDNWLVGGAGRDTFEGGAGDDVMIGENAAYYPFQGISRLIGMREREQADAAVYTRATQGIDVTFTFFNAVVTGQGTDSLFCIGRVVGSGFADRMQGDNSSVVFEGGAGADRLIGSLSDDILTGGTGNDTLTGGQGFDLYIFTSGDGADVITDFDVSRDRIATASGGYVSAVAHAEGVLVTLAGGGTVLLQGVTAGQLTAANFVAATGPSIPTALPGLPAAVPPPPPPARPAPPPTPTLPPAVNGTGLHIEVYGGLGMPDDGLQGLAVLAYGYGWRVVEATSTTFTIEVATDSAFQFYQLLTFRAATDFIYGDPNAFPTGVVDGVTAARFTASGLGGLGLTLAQIAANPALVFSGADTIVGVGAGATLQAGAGDDIVRGGASDDILDMGRGGGSVDGGDGADRAVLDFSDRSQVVAYSHNNTQAVVTVGGAATVTIKGIEALTIIGGSGADQITGGAGDDVIDLYRGGGVADGGAGADLVKLDYSNVAGAVVYGHNATQAVATLAGVSNATVRNAERVAILGGSGADSLTGGVDIDELSGGAGNDSLSGLGGADLLHGGDGDDSLDGGTGVDTALFKAAVVHTVDLALTVRQATGEGQDLIAGIENLTGGTATDNFYGDGGANILKGGLGDDRLEGRDGDDMLFGDEGSDTLVGGAGNDSLWGCKDGTYFLDFQVGAGSNVVDGGDGDDGIFGDNGNDDLKGGAGDDRIEGMGGADRLEGGSGTDFLRGGENDDRLYGGADWDSLQGEGGDDYIEGGAGEDFLEGWYGDDQLFGGDDADQILGGEGDDWLAGGKGDDDIEGGEGFDTIDYRAASTGVTLRMDLYNDPVSMTRQDAGGDGQDFVWSIEAAVGSAFADFITGLQLIDGGGGDDILQGWYRLDDALTGGAGNDTFWFTGGHDVITDFTAGGVDDRIRADDWYGYRSLTQIGTDTLVVFDVDNSILLKNVQASGLTAADFLFRAGPAPTGFTRTGGATADKLDGGKGADTLSGSGGDDHLRGQQGDDVIDGGGGADRIEGGSGFDLLTGGAGADIFVARALEGSKVIQDFNAAEGDKLYLESAFSFSFTQMGSDLLVILSTGDRLTLRNTVGTNELYNSIQLTTRTYAYEQLGTAGADTLTGDERYGLIQGLGGADILNGGGSDEVLEGGDGADRISGGGGNDTMTGGAGADIFVFAPGSNQDIITDFNVAEDRIDVSAYGATPEIYDGGGYVYLTFAWQQGVRIEGISQTQLTNANFILNSPPIPPTYALQTGTAAGETLTGTGGRDELRGLGGADTLNGGDGDDLLLGGDGDDVITGGAGADILTGGAGADRFVATVGGGNDTVTDFTVGTDKIDLTAFGGYLGVVQDGADALLQLSGVTWRLTGVTASTVTSASFLGLPPPPPPPPPTSPPGTIDTTQTGTPGHDVIVGDARNNNVSGSGGNDVLRGEGGHDILRGEYGDDILEGGDGIDSLEGGPGDNLLTGGAGADTFVLYDYYAVDVITDFSRGEDRIDARYATGIQSISQSGADTVITYGSGYQVRLKNIQANALTVSDFIGLTSLPTPLMTANTISGTSIADRLYGTARRDVIQGLGGNDEITAQSDDTVDGGAGFDELTLTMVFGDPAASFDLAQAAAGVVQTLGAVGSVVGVEELEFYGSAANDVVYGHVYSDRLLGGAGSDRLEGRDGDDGLEGGWGDDILRGGLGNDELRGDMDTGIDPAAQNPGDDDLDGGDGNDGLYGMAGDDLLKGGAGDDMLLGGVGNDVLEGGDGADWIRGDVYEAGSDVVRGGAGDDQLDVTWRDQIDGGSGIDTLMLNREWSFSTALVLDIAAAAAGIAQVVTGGGSFVNIERGGLGGGSGDDRLTGGALDDSLGGGGGADVLVGGAGNDQLAGGAGDDVITGGAGNDQLQGGAGLLNETDRNVFIVTTGGGTDEIAISNLPTTGSI